MIDVFSPRWAHCRGATANDNAKCRRCDGDGEVASGRVDEDGDECPPILCPRCGGTGLDPMRLVKAR